MRANVTVIAEKAAFDEALFVAPQELMGALVGQLEQPFVGASWAVSVVLTGHNTEIRMTSLMSSSLPNN